MAPPPGGKRPKTKPEEITRLRSRSRAAARVGWAVEGLKRRAGCHVRGGLVIAALKLKVDESR